MNRRVVLAWLAAAPLLAACGSAASSSPAASVRISDVQGLPTGVWEGALTGREMANAAGPATAKARLTLKEDGTFSMETPNGTATGTATAAGDRLVLEGRIAEPKDAPAQAPVRYDLRRARRGGLGGTATFYVLNHAATTGIDLKKVD